MENKYSSFVKILEKKKSYIAMIFVQFSYAGMALFSKAAISKGMNPYVFVAYRQAFAVFALAPFAFFLERKRADPLTYSLMWKIFLISLFGITLSLNLYTYALNYVSATFASASINTIPALTFLIAVMFRIESFSVRNLPGFAKFVGLVVSLSGAMVFAFVKGPQVNFMNWSRAVDQKTINDSVSTLQHLSNKDVMKGCLLMLSANAAWASWLVMQAPLVKQYPAKIRLTMLQCLFSCLQSTVWAITMERNVTSWKLQWDFNLFSVSYCGVVVTSDWNIILVASLGRGGQRPPFSINFHSFGLWHYLLLLSSQLFYGRRYFIWEDLICGGMLLVGGLYCVLWGKNKEAEIEANKEKPDSKEEITIV